MTATAGDWSWGDPEPVFAPVDDGTGSLLDLLGEDPYAEADQRTIEAAIRYDARRHDGHVSPNRVRDALDGKVKPQRVGPTYRRLCLAGLLVPDGWETSNDTKGRNGGKPHRAYRWTGRTS